MSPLSSGCSEQRGHAGPLTAKRHTLRRECFITVRKGEHKFETTYNLTSEKETQAAELTSRRWQKGAPRRRRERRRWDIRGSRRKPHARRRAQRLGGCARVHTAAARPEPEQALTQQSPGLRGRRRPQHACSWGGRSTRPPPGEERGAHTSGRTGPPSGLGAQAPGVGKSGATTLEMRKNARENAADREDLSVTK